MSFRLVQKSVTLNDLECRYFTEFGKPAFQHNRFLARERKFKFAISSAGELLILFVAITSRVLNVGCQFWNVWL